MELVIPMATVIHYDNTKTNRQKPKLNILFNHKAIYINRHIYIYLIKNLGNICEFFQHNNFFFFIEVNVFLKRIVKFLIKFINFLTIL